MTNVVVSKHRVKRYLCHCGKAYNRPALLEQHQRTHTGEQPFECDLCHARFFRKTHLQAHYLKHVPADQKPFKCPECGKGLNTQQHYDQHMKVHARPYRCPREGCGETFRMKLQLTWHINRHDRTCCGRVFSTQKKYESHVEKNHSQKYHCGCCPEVFDKFADLQQHLAARHTTPHETESHDQSEEPVFISVTCEPDQQQTVNRSSKRSVDDSVQPAKIVKVGPTISRITGVGYKDRPIECPEPNCDRRFLRQYDLDRHIAASHKSSDVVRSESA